MVIVALFVLLRWHRQVMGQQTLKPCLMHFLLFVDSSCQGLSLKVIAHHGLVHLFRTHIIELFQVVTLNWNLCIFLFSRLMLIPNFVITPLR